MTSAGSSQHRSFWRADRRAQAAHWLGLWLALVALVSQGFVHSHVHGAARPSLIQPVQASAVDTARSWDSAAIEDGCPLCQELGLDGLWLAPPPVLLPEPVGTAFLVARVTAAALIRVRPSHDWRSRAPPLRPRP